MYRSGMILLAAMFLLCGCTVKEPEPAVTTGVQNEESITSTVVSETSVSVISETTPSVRDIPPLTASRSECSGTAEGFSVCARLTDLKSSLYYPDIVNELGADPAVFVITARVRVKNLSENECSFDYTALTLSDGSTPFYRCSLSEDSEEKLLNIGSGKTATADIRYICSPEQAAGGLCMELWGNALTDNGKFIPDEFADIIEIQSADDVREHLYRPYYLHRFPNYCFISDKPTVYEFHDPRCFTVGDKRYLSVSYDAYNRSDYAQLIEPGAFVYYISEDEGTPQKTEPLYISADEELIPAPQQVSLELDGVGKLYEIPDFISMNSEGATEFTLIYEIGTLNKMCYFLFVSEHEELPYYSRIDMPKSVFEGYLPEEENE